MAKKRVLANFMHEAEAAAAYSMLTNTSGTDSYVIGDIDEQQIPALQAQGLIVQEMQTPGPMETPGAGSTPLPGTLQPSQLLSIAKGPGAPEEEILPPIDFTRPNYYLITLSGPLLEEWRIRLASINVLPLEYIPWNSYTAQLTPSQAQEVQGLPFVTSLRLYGQKDTGPIATSTLSAEAAGPVSGAPKAIKTYDIRLHNAKDLPPVLTQIQNMGVSVAGATGKKIRVYLLEDDTRALDIAALSEVASMEEYTPPQLNNDISRQLLGIDPNPQTGINTPIGYTGDGQIVAIADTGLDDIHPDFQGRIVGLVGLGRPNDTSDFNGHGTHVAGSVLGSGTASNGQLCGAAPGAQLFFQSLMDAQGGLGGLPLDLGDLFEEAYQSGARIHNNSWGSATRSMYTFNSIEVDEFVARRRDMLIVISAGNEGIAANSLHAKKGFVDWLSIGSPASAKNALTVGASRSSRTNGGIAKLTYGQVWPQSFPDKPISAQKVSGDPERIAAFSSRGPCTDRRIKPDLVAPGTDIASTKSSKAPLRNYWGAYPNNPGYAFMGGTSMAAPLVSGCAALVREYFVKTRNAQPSAALLKAALINGTRILSGPDSMADFAFTPNFHQGFGAIYLPTTIPNPGFPALKLEFVDNWQDPPNQFNRTGQRFRYSFKLDGGEWLRITLAYTDLPARGLQNDLNLFVQHMQTGQKWIGNADLPMGLKIPDPDNNVEVLRLKNPPPGDYLIQVSAINLLQAPQDFALVVSGELGSPLTVV